MFRSFMHFGEHLTIDGYNGDESRLNDKECLVTLIDDLCRKLEMHQLSDVIVVAAPDNQLKDPGGWSGFVIIAESHIAIHTFPKRRFVSADVYTCQNNVDFTPIIEMFKKAYILDSVETHHIQRGTKYPSENII